MAETKTKASDTAERAREAMNSMEDTMGAFAENNRRSLNATMELTRHSLNAGYQMARDLQEEQVRFADAMFDQFTKFQKNYLKSVQSYTDEFYRCSEKVMKNNQDMVEDAIDRSMELVAPGGRVKR